MLEEINQTFGHAKEIVTETYAQALAEGFSPTEAKHLIFSSAKSISPRTIYYYLPNESKDKKMQQLGSRKKSLQFCNDKTKSNNNDLLQLDESRRPKEQKTDIFMENLRKELDSRKITKEMYSLSASLENNKFHSNIKPIVQQNHEPRTLSIIFLSEKFAEYISNKIQINKTIGRASKFNLEHDGNIVTAVHEFSIT